MNRFAYRLAEYAWNQVGHDMIQMADVTVYTFGTEQAADWLNVKNWFSTDWVRVFHQPGSNAEGFKKGDVVKYTGKGYHISVIYTDPVCDAEGNCTYKIVHASGVGGYTDKDGVKHFTRKVIVMPNTTSKVIPTPLGFGRIKLWD